MSRRIAPALLTTTWSAPNASAAARTTRSAPDASARSAGTASARPPAASISAATASRGSARRPASTTGQPSRARTRAVERPIPVPPPVTSATRSGHQPENTPSGSLSTSRSSTSIWRAAGTPSYSIHCPVWRGQNSDHVRAVSSKRNCATFRLVHSAPRIGRHGGRRSHERDRVAADHVLEPPVVAFARVAVAVELADGGVPDGLGQGHAARRYRSDRYDRPMVERLYFTDDDTSNELIAQEPFALLIGFALDQQVTVQKAFAGPLAIRERVGTLDPAALAATDLEPVFRQVPAVHRYPANMAKRVTALAAHVAERYDGDAARVWTEAASSEDLKAADRRPPRVRRDEGQGARVGAREAVRRRAGRAARAVAPDAGRRGLAAGAGGVPGGQARLQGEPPRRRADHLVRRAPSREWRRDVSGVAAARATTDRWPTIRVAVRARVIAV